MAALREMGQLNGPARAPSLQFPWIDGPETLPLASVSAMDADFDWGTLQKEMDLTSDLPTGGLMDSPWAKICQSGLSQQQLKRLKR